MHARLIALSALVLVALVAAPGGAATPAEQLAKAREAFQQGKYEEAVPLLSYLLYPNVQLSRQSDLVEAHVLLGVAYFELDNLADAKREFDEALFLDAELTLDPLLFSDKAIAFFEQRKQALREQVLRDAEARALAEERDRLREALANMVVIGQKSYIINYVPFGAGQFQNGHTTKGIFFFASELILGGVSLGAWYWQVENYGIKGTVPAEEATRVRRAQFLQLGTGVAFFVVTAAGIIDALVHYESVTRLPADESLLPDELKPRKRGKQKRSPLNIAPTATPSGVGLVMSWEF